MSIKLEVETARKGSAAIVWRARGERLLTRLERLMSTDFCPWANRYVYWLKQPIGWFVCAALMSVLVGLFIGPQGYVLAAAIVGVMVLGVAWPWVAMRAVRCEMTFPQRRSREGDMVRVLVRVRNRFPWPVWGLSVERGFFMDPDATGAAAPALALARIPGWSESRFQWEFSPPRRGVYPTEPPLVANGFPFGIWTARRPLHVVNQLLVWPRTIRLTSIPPVSGQQRAVAAVGSRQVGDEGDFLGVRPFRQGDSLRHIHWPQTARHDQLIVCERQASARRTVRIWVDIRREVHVGSAVQGSLEWAIRVAASLAEQFHSHHCSVEMIVGRIRISTAPGPTGIHQLLDQLARFVPSQDEAGGRLPVSAVSRRRVPGRVHAPKQPGSLSIVVTTDAYGDPGPAPGWDPGPARLVVLRRSAFAAVDGRAAELSERTSAWIEVNNVQSIVAQLRHGWERVCHDGWDAA